VATAVYRFEPEITINEELMNTLTEVGLYKLNSVEP
jgi:hypothetical protein